MSHLDEGTLHALLDGELETTEVAEIQAHLGTCSACGLRLREVKEFLAESDRLIGSVELGDEPPASLRPAASPPPPQPAPAPRQRPAGRATTTEPWNEPPPLLLPDNETAADRRARRLRWLNRAAVLAVVAGAGLLWNNLYRGSSLMPPLEPRDTTAPAPPTAVLSPAETARPDSQPSLASRPAPPPADTPLAKAAARAPARDTATAPPVRQAPTQASREETQLANRDDLQTIDSVAESAGGVKNGDSAAVEDIAAVRARAAEALAQLDRERRRDRAAAATAALDVQKRSRPAAPAVAPLPAAAPAPPPPTPEQRAGIYLRIGLDEASRQLGGPAHVIEGMVPLFMGLAQGSAVPGADSTRPVVRVVYQDQQGRLLLLDQQRLRSGQTGFRSSALAWIQGEHAIWLHGEPGPEILRTYRPRVR